MPSGGPGAGGNLISAITQAVRSGQSQNAALQAFRNAGGTIRDAYFRQVFRNVQADFANRPTVANLPGHLRPPEEAFTPITARGQQRYVYAADLTVRPRGSGDIYIARNHITYSNRVSPNKALADILNRYQAPLPPGYAGGGVDVEGGEIVALYVTELPEPGE